MRGNRRVARALLFVSLLVAVASGAAACAGPEPESRRPGPKPQWDVSSLQAQLPGVLVVRGRALAIAQLDGSAETTIWTAPTETTPTILDVDRDGGRVAVLLRSKGETTTSPVGIWNRDMFSSVVDTGVVILSADGQMKRFPIKALERRMSLKAERLRGVTSPVDMLIADRVTSGAFVGRDLLLATDGPAIRYPAAGTPLRISPEGSCTVLSVSGTETVGAVGGFVGLAGGGGAVIRGPQPSMGGFSFPPRAMIAGVRDSALTTSSASFGSMTDQLGIVGSGPATQSIAYMESDRQSDAWALGKIVVATFEDGAWKKSSLPLSPRKDANGGVPRSLITKWTIMDAPSTGPRGEELLAIGDLVTTHRGWNDMPRQATLVSVGPSGVTTEGAGLRVEWSPYAGARTWAWLDRFGR
jgi:hypothetical protein